MNCNLISIKSKALKIDYLVLRVKRGRERERKKCQKLQAFTRWTQIVKQHTIMIRTMLIFIYLLAIKRKLCVKWLVRHPEAVTNYIFHGFAPPHRSLNIIFYFCVFSVFFLLLPPAPSSLTFETKQGTGPTCSSFNKSTSHIFYFLFFLIPMS